MKIFQQTVASTFYATALLMVSCAGSKTAEKRSARPTDQDDNIPGYLDSIERDINAREGGEISINKTVLKFPPSDSDAIFKVRLSRLASTPDQSQEEALTIGSAEGDVIAIEIYDPETDKILTADQWTNNYEFKQEISTQSMAESLGMVVITDPSADDRKKLLIPNGNLTITSLEAQEADRSRFDVGTNLRATALVVWIATYTQEAEAVLTTSDGSAITSTGGNTVNAGEAITSQWGGHSSIAINAGAPYTTLSSVQLTLADENAHEMYITNTVNCADGGTWEAMAGTKSWSLSQTNSVARVYVKFRDQAGNESSCVSDSVIHDEIAPTDPSTLDDGTGSIGTTTSPAITWAASSDAGSGVDHYEVAIGTTAGGTNIKNWTNVGNAIATSVTGLNLTLGTQYYVSIKAVDRVGNASSEVRSNGFVGSTGFHTIFITDINYDGAMGGLTGADNFCRFNASYGSSTSSLLGTWRAILSSSTISARDRISLHAGHVIKNTNGDIVLNAGENLWTATLSAPIKYNEHGAQEAAFNGVIKVWSGSNGNGEKVAGAPSEYTCTDWTSSDAGATGNAGNALKTNSEWLFVTGGSITCVDQTDVPKLYCINARE